MVNKKRIEGETLNRAFDELKNGLQRYLGSREYCGLKAVSADIIKADIIIRSLKSTDERDAFLDWLKDEGLLIEGKFSNQLLSGCFSIKDDFFTDARKL